MNAKGHGFHSLRDLGLDRPRVDRTLVLIGLMGAGKSSVGRRLAHTLGLNFVDSDKEVEIAAGCSVNEIFDLYGEKGFRDGERRVIARLLDGTPQVLATGGGAFMNDETRALIKQRGLSIWLDADVDLLVERTSRRDTRPLLREGDPAEILRNLAAERYPVYAEADLRVKTADGPHEQMVRVIVEALLDHESAQS